MAVAQVMRHRVRVGQAIDTLTAEFVKFIQSKDGQQVVVKDGYYPLPKEVGDETQALLAP